MGFGSPCRWGDYANGLSWNQHLLTRKFARQGVQEQRVVRIPERARLRLHDHRQESVSWKTRADQKLAARFCGATSARLLTVAKQSRRPCREAASTRRANSHNKGSTGAVSPSTRTTSTSSICDAMQNFDIIDNSDVGDDEERQVATVRRMFMYSPKALQTADEVKRKYVIFRDLKRGPDRVRPRQLVLRIRQPQEFCGSVCRGRRRPVSPSTSAGACPPRLTSLRATAPGHPTTVEPVCRLHRVVLLLRAVRHPFTVVRRDL